MSYSSSVRRLLANYWLLIFAVLVLAIFLVIGHYNETKLHYSPSGCMKEALTVLTKPFPTCIEALQNAVIAASAYSTHFEQPTSIGTVMQFWSDNVPKDLVQLDNIAVDLYTLVFIGSACSAYKRLTTVKSNRIVIWRTFIGITCFFALAGAIADHAENFWILAHMKDQASDSAVNFDQLPFVVWFSIFKFRMFFLNVVILIVWWLAAFVFSWIDKRQQSRLRSLLLSKLEDMNFLKVEEHNWPEFLQKEEENEQSPEIRWQRVFYHYFFNAINSDGTFKYSFSIYAVSRWRRCIGAEVDQAALQRLLSLLSNSGDVALHGTRYEIVWSSLAARRQARES